MVLFDSPNLKIEFSNVPCRHLRTTWSGIPVSEEYQRGVLKVLNCCRENDIQKLITDIRLQEPVKLYDQQMADLAMQNHSKICGYLYQAVVLSSEVFVKFSELHFDNPDKERYHLTQFFSNPNDALRWLKQIDS